MPTYALVLRLEAPAEIQVGGLGRCAFQPGYYVYVGSAAKGLWRRLARHLRREKRLRWHIDYLTRIAAPVEVWCDLSLANQECLWARLLLRSDGATLAVRGFGASDCGCGGHLVCLPAMPHLDELLAKLAVVDRSQARPSAALSPP